MRLSGNLLAGLANSIWSALIGLAVVPFYLKYLGIEAYGLIGFFVTTQALLSLLDMGLAPTINREVARQSASGNLKEAGKLLHTLAVVYWAMAGVIALVIVVLAPLIAEYWLQSRQLSQDTVAHALMLMGLVVACRWPVGLYMGALMGMQRIALSSTIGAVVGTLSSLGAVAVLAFVSPTIGALFIWQAGVGLVYAATMRWAAWRVVGRLKNIRFDIDKLKQIWRFSAGMSGVAIAGAILMQLDKVLLSRMLSLEDFGKYSLAGAVTGGLLVLLTPVFNAIYPRFSALVAAGDTEILINLYRMGTRLLSIVLFPIAILAGVFAEDIVFLWTGNWDISIKLAPIVHLLLIGTAINGVMIFPFALQLSYGAVRLPLMICLILIAVSAPMTIILVMKYGVTGGALSWVLMNSVYLLMGSWLTHRVILKGIGFKWLFWDVTVPLAFSLLVIGGAGEKIHDFGLSHIENAFIAFGIGLFAILVLILASPRTVRLLRSSIKESKSHVEPVIRKEMS